MICDLMVYDDAEYVDDTDYIITEHYTSSIHIILFILRKTKIVFDLSMF